MNDQKSLTRSVTIMLMLGVSGGVAGCDVDPGGAEERQVQKDIYTGSTRMEAFQKCVIDWGNEELCKELADKDAEKHVAASHGGGGGPGFIYYISGPGYYGDRSVNYGGRRYAPTTSNAMKVAAFSPSTGKFSGLHAPSVRGGFGATGGRSGGAFGGG